MKNNLEELQDKYKEEAGLSPIDTDKKFTYEFVLWLTKKLDSAHSQIFEQRTTITEWYNKYIKDNEE